MKLDDKVSESYIFTAHTVAIVLLLNSLVRHKLEVLAEVTNRLDYFRVRLVDGVSWLCIHEPFEGKVLEVNKIV